MFAYHASSLHLHQLPEQRSRKTESTFSSGWPPGMFTIPNMLLNQWVVVKLLTSPLLYLMMPPCHILRGLPLFPMMYAVDPNKDDPILDETPVLEGPIFHVFTSMIFGEMVNHPFDARGIAWLHIPQALLPISHRPGLASRCQPSLFKHHNGKTVHPYPALFKCLRQYELWIPDRLALF